MERLQKLSLWLGLVALLAIALCFALNYHALLSPFSIIATLALAIGLRSVKALKSYQYTAWIIAAIICGLIYPAAFLQWGKFDLRNKWLILIVIQVVMFGMGTQMSLKDFTGIRKMGKGVLVGLICQFSIMPITGYFLTRVFNFEPEIAAGVILIGSCSSGLASNVMVYLAKANLALSVTLTSVATLLAPIMTPFWMKVLAGTYIDIVFIDMCFQIIKIVIVPIGAAMLFDGCRQCNPRLLKRINLVFYVALFWLAANMVGLWAFFENQLNANQLKIPELFNFLSGAVVFGKLFYLVNRKVPKLCSFMPKLSMFGIVYFTIVTTAASRDYILAIGLFMLIASIIHNSLGYSFGYWISRGLKMDKDSARTVALEVGLQNGGMASGLAGVMGKLATVGLASAIFSPWMNISGSVLANYWKRKKERERVDNGVEDKVERKGKIELKLEAEV